MSDQTEPDASTQAEEEAEAGRDHVADRPATEEENERADENYAQSDSDERKSVAEHEEEMMEIGADVKGEGAIE
jgi:hypothetical protein